MSNRIVLMLGAEESVTAGVGNSTNVGRAKLVRVYNSSGSANVITVEDPLGISSYSGVGSITVAGNAVEYVQKDSSYNIWGSGAFKATNVGFTN